MSDIEVGPLRAALTVVQEVRQGQMSLNSLEAVERRLSATIDSVEGPQFVKVRPAVARSLIGEGLHTGLRKGCENGDDVWHAIRDMPDDDWSAALSFLVDGLESMGYVLCEKKKEVEHV